MAVAAAGPAAKDWASFYAREALAALKLPALAQDEPGLGRFRAPAFALSDLLAKGAEAGGVVAYCDLLRIDAELSVEGPLFVLARRIEVAAGAGITLNRIGRDFELAFIYREAAGPDGALADLSLNEVFLDGGGMPGVESVTVAGSRGGAGPVTLRAPNRGSGKLSATVSDLTELDSGLDYGAPLRLLLGAQMQIAILNAERDPDRAKAILNWVSDLAALGRDGFELRTEADLMLARVTRLAKAGDETVTAPDFDHEVFAAAATAAIAFAVSRQQDWHRLDDKADDADARAESLRLQAEDRTEETTLIDAMVDQSRALVTAAQVARANAIKDLALGMTEVREARDDFLAKLDKWVSEQTKSEVINLLKGVGEIALNIPVFVAAGPQVKGIMETSAAADIARSAAEGVLMHIDDIPRGGRMIDAINPFRGEESQLRGVGERAEQARRRLVMRLRRGDARESVAMDDNDVPMQQLPRGVFDLDNDHGLSDAEDIRVVVDDRPPPLPPGRGDAAPDLPPPPLPPDPAVPPPLPPRSMTDNERAEYEGYRNQKRKLIRDRLEKSALAANAMLNAGNRVYEGASNVANAANRLAEISETADKVERLSDDMVAAAEAGFVSSTKLTLDGIDTVTGGKQVWENALLEIENMFDQIGDGLLGQIDNQRVLRLALRKCVVDGRTLAEAKVALASANVDLAQLLLRQGAARNKARNVARALEKLENRQAELDVLGQIAASKVIEAKTTAYLSIDAYRRALLYYALNVPANLRLPKLADDVETYERAAREISGRLLTSTALPTPPQEMIDVRVLADAGTLGRFKASRDGVVTWRIGLDEAAFAGLARVRLSRVRLYIDGLTDAEPIDVGLTCGPEYLDRGVDGTDWRFIGPNIHRLFRYVPSDERIVVDGSVAKRHEHDYFQPTPFATWKITVERRGGGAIDLAAVTGLRMVVSGYTNDLA